MNNFFLISTYVNAFNTHKGTLHFNTAGVSKIIRILSNLSRHPAGSRRGKRQSPAIAEERVLCVTLFCCLLQRLLFWLLFFGVFPFYFLLSVCFSNRLIHSLYKRFSCCLAVLEAGAGVGRSQLGWKVIAISHSLCFLSTVARGHKGRWRCQDLSLPLFMGRILKHIKWEQQSATAAAVERALPNTKCPTSSMGACKMANENRKHLH